MILDWIFSPYCSSGWIAHQAEEVYGLTLKPWNLADVRDAMYSIIPRHITDKVKEIRQKGQWSNLQGAQPLFFINGPIFKAHNLFFSSMVSSLVPIVPGNHFQPRSWLGEV